MQNSYILLRDNKESVSLSIKELQAIGLKETDLIWVECQSMNWRSPREIPELKNLLAAKKYNDKINKTDQHIEPAAPDFKNQSKKTIAGSQIAGAGIKDFENFNRPEPAILSAFENKEAQSGSKIGFFPGIIREGKPRYRTQKEQGNKGFFGNHLPDHVKKWTLYAGLVLAGALLMFLILNLGGRKAAVMQQKVPKVEKIVPPTATKSSTPHPNPAAIARTNEENPGLFSKNSLDSVKKIRKKKVAAPKAIPLITAAGTDSQNIISIDTEKNIKPVAEVTLKQVSIGEVTSKIALKANDYDIGFMGGIRNLAITLQNNTGYLLNKVVVEIDYLNSSGNIVNTDQINFQSVKAGDIAVLPVNKSKRGVKVKYHIIHVECKALGSRQAAAPDSGSNPAN